MSSLPPFPSFDITDQVSLGPSWEKWLNLFENFLIALNLNDARKKALLLHYAGEAVYDIYDTLQSDDDDYPAVRHKLSVHFKPVKLERVMRQMASRGSINKRLHYSEYSSTCLQRTL